jgi:hypothetical protein
MGARVSVGEAQITERGDGFRYSRDPVTKSLSIVVPPRRQASGIAFLGFCVAFAAAWIAALLYWGLPQARGSAFEATMVAVMALGGVGMFLLVTITLGTHLFQRTTIEVTRATITIRRRCFMNEGAMLVRIIKEHRPDLVGADALPDEPPAGS